MFYRPGGSDSRVAQQFDEVFTDVVDGATGWLPVNSGNMIGVNIARASIIYDSAASSKVTRTAEAPEVVVLMEMSFGGGDADSWPIDEWQNMVVAASRRAHRDGWVRLRVTNINQQNGDGVSMALQVSRNGNVGV